MEPLSLVEVLYQRIRSWAEHVGLEADEFALSEECCRRSDTLRWVVVDGKLKFEFLTHDKEAEEKWRFGPLR